MDGREYFDLTNAMIRPPATATSKDNRGCGKPFLRWYYDPVPSATAFTVLHRFVRTAVVHEAFCLDFSPCRRHLEMRGIHTSQVELKTSLGALRHLLPRKCRMRAPPVLPLRHPKALRKRTGARIPY